MIRAIVDLFATIVQTYISACLVCKIFSVKQPYRRSLLLAFLQMMTSYFVVNYIFNETIPQRVVCGGIVFVIGGFLVVNELFTRILEQQKKQSDLEQMALEQQYQYDYYKKAYEQSEEIRDIRHDMRNQLQTVEVLLRSEQEIDRIRGNEMIERLSEKIC